MENHELIAKLENLEVMMIPSCFKADMEAVKGQMLELIYKMIANSMSSSDVVAVLEVFIAYLRQEEQSCGGETSQKMQDAKDFLKTYICCCPYGKNPSDCSDRNCKFGQAIRLLAEEELETGEEGDSDD